MRGRDAFAAAFKQAIEHYRIDATSDIQEIQVLADWAYCWNQLTVTLHPVGGGAATHLSGPALTVFRKKSDGTWVLFRDANMITPAR